LGDLRRERDSARTERDQLRQENQNLRRILGDIDPVYADTYALLCDIALNGTRLDNPKTSSAFESQPPRYNPIAYHLRNEERRIQRQRATKLRNRLENLENGPTLVPPTNSTPLAQPSRKGASVHTNLLHYQLSFRRVRPQSAPQTEPD
jgi:hypothetical protein